MSSKNFCRSPKENVRHILVLLIYCFIHCYTPCLIFLKELMYQYVYHKLTGLTETNCCLFPPSKFPSLLTVPVFAKSQLKILYIGYGFAPPQQFTEVDCGYW